MSNSSLSSFNKKKLSHNKQSFLVSSFSSKFFQNLENNIEKESKGTPRNYYTESSKQNKSIKIVSNNKSISLNSQFQTLSKSNSRSPLRNSKINVLSKSINNNKLNCNKKNLNTQSIFVKKANLTKHKKSISLSQKSNCSSRSKLKIDRNNSFNNSKFSIKNKLQNITPINNNNLSKLNDYSIIKNNSIEARPYSMRIVPGIKKQSSILKKNIRNNSKKNSLKNNLSINDNFFTSKNFKNSFNSKFMNMEILKNNLSPKDNLSIGKNNINLNYNNSNNLTLKRSLDKKNFKKKKKKIEKKISVTEGNDFLKFNFPKEKNIVSPLKKQNKQNGKNHRPKSKSFFGNKLLKSEKIQDQDKYELKQISSLTELKSENNSITNNSPLSTSLTKNPIIQLNNQSKKYSSNTKNIYNNNMNNINNNHIINNNNNINQINNQNINKNNQINNNINNINLYKNTISSLNINKSSITSPKIKKIMKIDSCTSPGYSSPGIMKTNQDSFFIEKDFLDSPEHFFLGVCDGHGLHGHLISDFISNTLPQNIHSPTPQSITSGFLQTNSDLVTLSNIDCNLSGSTCVSLLITLTSITCANVGDSRAVLATCENGFYSSINLSRDQKPTENDEMKRILQYNGRIAQYFDEESRSFIGPKRIWLKNSDIPGLAMTRSFGDLIAHSVGVICEPEIGFYWFRGCEKFVIVASDGVWEFIDSEESVHIVKNFYENGMDASGAVNALVKEAYRRWRREEDIIDDITVIVVFFD